MSTSPKQLGKYELQERLGQGGMAEVWKALDPQLKRYVAIKFLHANLRSDPDFMNRFQREGQAIAALRHPNIVQVYDFQVSSPEDENQMAYMVMDYIEGSTLADYIRRTSYAHNFPSDEEIVRLFTPISLAIDYAHRQRMIHRDIKPANILLDTRNTVHNSMGEPILTDFGIVKMLGTATITSTGTSMGTPLYISPEQVEGQPGNERSDIYSLGVMLYEICAGQPIYRGDTPYAIMAQHVNGHPIPPSQLNSHISSEVDAVISCCLAKDPQARFSNAAAMIVALSAAFHLPVPDQVRYSISSFNQQVRPSSSNPSHPELPSNSASYPEISSISSSSSELPTIAPTSDAQAARNDDVEVSEGETVAARLTPSMSESGATKLSGASYPLSPAGPVTPLPASMATPILPVAPTRRTNTRKRLFAIASIILVILLLGGSAGVYVLLRGRAATPVTSTIVGTASFFSSSQFGDQGASAINDSIQVHLQHVSDPATGNNYYAWLQDNQAETASVFLGVLKVTNGDARLSYTDAQHRDLLAQMSRFLVTEETASVTPGNPSLNAKQWRYVASFPQKPSPVDNFSYLDHIRHLLSGEPALAHLHLQNGVDYWLQSNTEEMYKSAIEARDHGSLPEVRQLLTDILYYLDGKCASQDLNGAPGPKVPENTAIMHAATISLLDCTQLTEPPGHLTHVALHLNGIVKAPGAPAQQIPLAAQVNSDLNPLRAWMQQLRTDALQLVQMDDAHLGQARALRNDMVIQASYTIGGRVDPSTRVLQPGVEQICGEISLLATLEVFPYNPLNQYG
ncbi:MAG: serine/threonine protein kinase [Ktedonobacteraceae bacterium]|nr:serine/threonine protein kinase [Ktedonobacteraceae bacterium]